MDPIAVGKRIKAAYPQYANVDDAAIGNKYLQKYGGAVAGVSSGKIKITDIPEAQRVGVSLGLESPAENPDQGAEMGKITAQQAGLAKAGLQNIQKVKELYLKDPNLLTKQLMPGKFASREYDSAAYDTADALLRLRTGAQANEQEIRGYMKTMMPNFGDDPNVVAAKIKKLEDDFKITLGRQPDAQPIDTSKIQSKSASGNPIIDFLLGSAINTAKDVGVGAGATRGGMQPALNQGISTGEKLSQQAMQEQDPEKRKRMLALANSIFGQTGQSAQQFAQSFSPDVQQNPIERGLTGASEITAVAGLPSFLSSVKNAGSKLIHPFRAVGEQRAAAIAEATGKTVSGDKVVSALEEGGKNISPTAKAGYDRFLETAKNMYQGKNLTVKEVVDLNTAANDAYTAAGKVGKASTAKFNKVLGDILKSELRINAPKVAEANQLFSRLYGAQKTFARVAPGAVAATAASGVASAALYKLLGNRGH